MLESKINKTYAEYKRWFQIGIPALIYILGVLATGIDRSEPGISLNPFKGMAALFSESGKALITLLFLIPMLIFLVYKTRSLSRAGQYQDEQRNFWFSNKDTYGTAELMDNKRMRRIFNCVPESQCDKAEGDIIGIKDGFVLSRPANSRHNKHMAAIGASGSMKSRAILRNKILGSVRRGESFIVTDPKGELFRDTAVWLRKKGYNVQALNLVSLEKSSGWNFMADALGHCEKGEEQGIVDQIAHVIIQNTGSGKEDQAFWDKGEKGLLKAILLYQFYTFKLGQGPLTFSWAYTFLLNNSIQQMKTKFEVLERQIPVNSATSAFNAFLKADENNNASKFHFGLLNRLDIFSNNEVQRIVGQDGIDLELPAKEKCAYFVITPDQHSTYDFLACLFFTLLFIRLVKYADTKTISGKCDIPVNLLLDEFPNIGEIPDFPKKIATVRSRDISVCILFQSIPDLTERYPDPGHWRILGNCDYIVFLGGSDPHTANFFSERSGETTIAVDTIAEQHNKFDPLHFTLEQRESSGTARRLVLTLNEVQTMAKNNSLTQLIVVRDQPILQCEKFDYTRDPESQNWEPFSMKDYDPNDPFWGHNQQTHTPEQKQEPEAPTSTQPFVNEGPAEESQAAAPTEPDTHEPSQNYEPSPPDFEESAKSQEELKQKSKELFAEALHSEAAGPTGRRGQIPAQRKAGVNNRPLNEQGSKKAPKL